jgi:hypothetical protein
MQSVLLRPETGKLPTLRPSFFVYVKYDSRCRAGRPTPGPEPASPPTWPLPGELVKEGIALHDKEDYAGAIAKYQAVTPGDSSCATAQSELAMSLFMTGKNEKSAPRAIALRPFHHPTYNSLVTVFAAAGRPLHTDLYWNRMVYGGKK